MIAILMANHSDTSSDWTYEQLQAEADEIRGRLRRLGESLSRFFVGKQAVIELMTVSAIAQEPLLLIGPPGAAKSELVVKYKDALGVPDEDYFEYMLTRFSEPSEILGPVDLNALREGAYRRRVEGKLPTARVAFLDEIFKSNSAVLNLLLTLINERKFYQDGRPQPVRLKVLLAAANEIPPHGELDALKDRFTLRVASDFVQREQFADLIDTGLAADADRTLRRKPWAEGLATLEDVLKAGRYLALQFAQQRDDAAGRQSGDRDTFFPPDVFEEFQRLVRVLAHEERLLVSDRRIVKLFKLLRARAWLLGGGVVRRDDLRLLANLGDSLESLQRLEQRVKDLLDLK